MSAGMQAPAGLRSWNRRVGTVLALDCHRENHMNYLGDATLWEGEGHRCGVHSRALLALPCRNVEGEKFLQGEGCLKGNVCGLPRGI